MEDRDWFYEFSLLALEDERRVYEEELPPLPEPRPRQPERHTLDEWRELKIADCLCPMPGCAGGLDDDFFCSSCGCTSLPRQVSDEVGRVAIPLPPHELPFDEYAAAQVWDDAA